MSEVNVGIETLCNVEASFDGVNLNVNVEVCPAGAEFTQIQSDWNQSDNTAVDYIKNKPTIDTALSAVSRIGVNLTGSGTVLDPLKFQAVDWAADTLYRTLQLITYEGELYRVATEFTSGATFDATNLERIEPKVATPVTPDYTAVAVGDKLQDVAEKVAGIGDIPKRIDFKSKIDNLSLTRRVRYAIPSEFKWQDSPINSSIYFDDLGNAYVLGFDASSYKITGTTYYVATTGNDLNDGSQATPFLTIQKALDQVDVDCVIVESGTYQIADTLTLKRDCSIIGEENVHIEMLTSHTDWTLTSDRINTWRRNIVSSVNATGVYEKFYNFEDYTKYAALGSINLVEATPGSYIAGSYLYVHALNSLKPSENVFVANGKRCIRNDGFSMYLENIKITGGWYVVFAELGGTIVAKDCIFMYSGRNCVNVDSTGLTIMQNCIAANSYYDGFNYHNYTGDTKVIEINCESYNNGRVGDSANQGSTAHNGIPIIRINGKYHNNLGSGIADINTDTHSLNINCSSFLSKASSIPTYNAAFAALTSAKLWVINSIGFSNTYGILAQTGATVYTSNNVISGDNVIEGTGTIVSI